MADSTNDAAATSSASISTSASSAQQYNLVVLHPFGDYAKGDSITDAATVTEVLAGENARSVRKVSAS